jgi:hypothetical protein
MDQNQHDNSGERTNALNLPASDYQELQTERAFARFNNPKRPTRDERRDRDDRRG